MEFLRRVLLIFLLLPGAAFAQEYSPAPSTNGGGQVSFVPQEFYANGASVNLQNGNLALGIQDILLPNPLGMGLFRSFNAGIGPMQLEEFAIVFEGALPHTAIQTRLDGRDTEVVGRVDRIVYENDAIDLGALGRLESRMQWLDPEQERPLNEITLRAGAEGWNVAWSNYIGVLVLLNVSPNATQRPAIVLLINKEGGAEPFDFTTGESLWDKTGSQFLTPFGTGEEDVAGLNSLLLRNPEGARYQFDRIGDGTVHYQVYYSFPCDRWDHFSAGFSLGIPLFSFTRTTCHADYRLEGWRVFGFLLKRAEDDAGHVAEADTVWPSPGIPQNILDESGRRIIRRIDATGAETWETMGPPDGSGQREARVWRMQFDPERYLHAATDPEANTTVYRYAPNSSPLRSLGWDSLTEPDRYLQIEYPTGGVMRYEWFGEEIRQGEEEAGGNTFVIVTEFPDPADRSVYHQKYHWVNEVTDPEPQITSTVFDLDGSVKEHRFQRIRSQWREAEEGLTGDGFSQVKNYTWHLNPDEKTIDGIERIEVTREGLAYTEAQMTYDDLGRVSTVTDANGLRTEYTYVSRDDSERDLASRVRQQDPNGGSRTTHYVYGGQDACGRNLNARQLNYIYNPISGEEQVVKKYCYDHIGNVIRELEGNKYKTQPPVQIAFSSAMPPEGTEQMVYDEYTGMVLLETDAYGVRKQYTYNRTGSLLRTRFSDGSYIANVFDIPGRALTTTVHDHTTGRNVIVQKRFDGLGNLLEERLGEAITRYRYNPMKQIEEMIYPDDRRVQYDYDALGRIRLQNLSGHDPIRYGYATQMDEGIPLEVVQANVGNTPAIRIAKDLNGNVRRMEKLNLNGEWIAARFGYDALGNLLNVQTPAGLEMSDAIDYDSGEVTRTFPGGDIHQFNLYDSSDHGEIHHRDRAGNQVSAGLRFDNATGLLQEIAWPGQSQRLNYGADGVSRNRLTSVADNAGSTRFAYNAGGASEVIEREIAALGETYAFYQVKDSFGNLIRLIYPNGLIVYYRYDEQNRVTEVRKDSEAGLIIARFEYEGGSDQPARIVYANGVTSQYSYDLAGRVVRIDVIRADGTYVQQERYTYDARGRKTQVRHLDGSRVVYEYDGLNRLTAARYFRNGETTASQFQEYAYDRDGNRVRYRDPLKTVDYRYENGRLSSYEIRRNDAVIHQGSLQYALGDVTGQTESTLNEIVLEKEFEFDAEHRLAGVRVNDQRSNFHTDSRYTYDYTGRRESVTVDGRTRYFLYGESIDPLMELNGQGEVEAFHIFVNGFRLAKIAGDELDFFHADEMGNVLKMTDAAGVEIQTVRYDPFGNVNFLNGSEHNDFLFAGKPFDQATGLYYFGARHYDPALGRFLSRDPLLQGTNHYIYADNNPVGNRDLYGLWGFHLNIGLSFNFDGIVAGAGITFTAGKFSLGIDASTFLTGGSDSLAKSFLNTSIGLGPVSLQNGALRLNFLDKLLDKIKIPGPLGKIIRPFRLMIQPTVKDGKLSLNFKDLGGRGLVNIDQIVKAIAHPSQFAKILNFNPGAFLLGSLKEGIQSLNGFKILAIGQRLLTKQYDEILAQVGGAGSSDIFTATIDLEPDGGLTDFNGDVTGDGVGGGSGTSNFDAAAVDPSQTQEGNFVDEADKAIANVYENDGNVKAPGVSETVNPKNTSDPILLHSGDLLQKETDLRIPGRGFDYEFTRVYRSRITYDGPLGASWDHNYNKRLVERENGDVARFDGEARFDVYERLADGSYQSPSGYFDTLTKNADGTFAIRDRYGTVNQYGADGWLVSIRDRNNNSIAFAYDGEGESRRLIQVTDTVGRVISYSYNAQGRLASITDFTGRSVQFGYNDRGDLISVTNPAGHTVRYTYSSGYPDDRRELNHNLLTVTDAKGQTYLRNTYSIYDRVIRQRFGDEGTFEMEYNQVASSRECSADLIDRVFYRTRVTDRIGNPIDYTFNCQGNPLQMIRYTRGVRPGDPASYTTSYRYNEDGLVTRITKPAGNAVEYEYDASGNLIAQRREGMGTTFAYDPNFSQPLSVVDAMGRETTFTLDERGNVIQRCREGVCETYAYNAHGQIISLTDGEGNTDGYRYDESGYLSEIIRDSGDGRANLTNRFSYDAAGNITSFTDGRGNTFTFAVNALNQVARELAPAPLNYERNIEYDENNNVVRVSGNAVVETRFTYNILDRVTTKTEVIEGARTALTEYRYDLNENLTRVIEPEGNSTFIEYDERDLPHRVIQGYRSEIETPKYFSYDLNGNVQTIRDGNGHITRYEYDGFDRLQRIIDPLANEMEVVYDEVSNITSITRRGPPAEDSPQLARTEFVYDALNRLIRRTESDVVTQYAYDRANRLTQLTNADNNVTRFIYDGADRLVQTTDAADNQTHYGYDANGSVMERRSMEGAEIFTDLFAYDALNRLIRRSDNSGHAFTYEYDSRGNLIATTDPKDTAGLDNGATTGEGNRVRYMYDGLNRLIEEVKELTNTGAGDGAVTDTIATRYGYDDNSRLTEITDANNHATRFVYDALNRQVEVRLHNANTYAKRYDPNGNLIEETQPNGHRVASIYDALNRLITKEITLRGSRAGREVFEYDDLSRMTRAQNFDPFDNPLGTVEYEYDSLSRVIAEIQNGRRLSKTYDGVGNITSRTYPSGRIVTNTYDALNRLTAITQTPTPEGIIENIFGADPVNILNAQYLGKDRPSQFNFGNGVQTDFVYDSLKRLTNIAHSTSSIAQFSYGYDKAGNQLFETVRHPEPLGEGSRNFTYDSIYRLTQVTQPSLTQQWTFDGVDNWLTRQTVIASPAGEAISRVTQFNPNEVNAYTTVDGTPYLYDENGNLTDDGTNTYQYNYRNLLTRVVDKAANEEIASYGYDALGRRIFKTVDGQMTRYAFEGIHIIAEIAPDDTVSREFIYGNSIDDPIAVIARSGSDEAIYYYHKDGLGSVVSLTDSAGAVAETYTYGAYGEVEIHDGPTGALLTESAAGNPFLYTGQMYDAETGFYYYKARYYHPTLGRFLQRDPLGYVDGYNLYAYVNNNPLNWVDPLGFGKVATQELEAVGLWSQLTNEIKNYVREINQDRERAFQRQRELSGKVYSGQATQAEKEEYNNLISNQAYEMATGMIGGVKFVGGGAKIIGRQILKELPDVYEGVKKASQYLREMGVGRIQRMEILKSFEKWTIRVHNAGLNEFGLRYYDEIKAMSKGSYLFETFPASRQSLSISSQWNQMTKIRQWQVKPGATVIEGRAASQGLGLGGGQTQKFILNSEMNLLP